MSDARKAEALFTMKGDREEADGMDELEDETILFKWNDSDEEMEEARRLAVELGIDRLCWEITDHPESAFSRRVLTAAVSAV